MSDLNQNTSMDTEAVPVNTEETDQMPDGKLELLKRLGKPESEFFVMMSACTKAPYVVCDPETFDDEVLLFFTEEEARKELSRLTEDKIPVTLAKLNTKQMLLFFTSLYTMGVNALLVFQDGETAIVQIDEIVKRKSQDQMPDGAVWVENPELHLTALYFGQALRSPSKEDIQSRLAELQEELTAHFKRGKFIFALGREEQGTPLVKLKDGNVYQPVFTDVLEFQRFNRENKFRPVVVEGENLPKVLAKEAKGVLLNMMSVNLPLMVGRTQQTEEKTQE